jgi:peroxiredoxin Q/BCP
MLKIGDSTKHFCLPDQNNNFVCLNDYLGKWVVLYFYPKDNTPGCTIEAKDFSCVVSDFEKINTEIIGVSPDSPKSHTNFITKHDLEINLLSDPDHTVLQNYGVWQKKKLYGKEHFGVVRSTYIINPEGTVAYVWHKVKVDGHVDEVKNKLKDLQDAY